MKVLCLEIMGDKIVALGEIRDTENISRGEIRLSKIYRGV